MNKVLRVDELNIEIYADRQQMGSAAADKVAEKISALLAGKPMVNIIFAAAPSQNELLTALSQKNLEWSRINAFHMDEYVGLAQNAPQGFGNFLKQLLFDKVNFNAVHYINGNATDLKKESERYTALLKEFPTDIVCMGIGENGHLAFNDPPVADFNDQEWVKVVELDHVCRQQQVNDGCFANISDVPVQALTLTIPTLMKGKYIYCVVPGKTKQEAVYNTIHQNIVEKYPSTILRKHSNAILFLDAVSAELIK